MTHNSSMPLIYALSGQIDRMKFHPKTGNIVNRKKILQNIGELYEIDSSVMDHIQLIKTPAGFQYAVHGCVLEDLLLPFWKERALNILKERSFPQLTTEMLFSTVFGIHHIINSTRLDIRYDVIQPDDSHWYFQRTCKGRTLNRQYFYEGLQDYVLTKHRAELFYHYLSATSSGSSGGASTIAYFDVAELDGQHTVIIPNTQFTYNDILNAIVETPDYQKLILKNCTFASKPSLYAVKAALKLLQALWQCFTIDGNGQKSISPFDGKDGLIVRNETLRNIRWREVSQTRIFDSCHFISIDFTDKYIQDDFLFCTFENCRFTRSTIPSEGVQGRFPILRCSFVNCMDVPKDNVFQGGIKNCIFS